MLGINSQIKSTSGGGEGVGFAVPVDTVRRSLRELREDGKVDYGYLGVTSQPLYPQLAERLDLPTDTGALIVQVQDGSPADNAGPRRRAATRSSSRASPTSPRTATWCWPWTGASSPASPTWPT